MSFMVFFYKQKTAYEMRISDWSSDVCSSDISNEQVQMRTCPLCEGMCGIEVRVQDGQVLSVRPDRDNVLSRGHMCPKGTTMGALHHDPDRLRGPVIKKNGTWHEVGWEEALRHCERIAHPVIKQYGSQA